MLVFLVMNLILFVKSLMLLNVQVKLCMNLGTFLLVEQKTPKTLNTMSSELLFKDINLIFYKKLYQNY